MSAFLPDVNVLIAFAWPSHVHHRLARAWFARSAAAGWATCPFTQSGFVRISSNPRIVDGAVTPREALALLRQMTEIGRHAFWPDDLDFTRPADVPTGLLVERRQATDAYLLGLAIRRGGRLVTLDRSVADLLPAASAHRGVIKVIPIT
ncbi:MAG: hypothetical protein HY321_17065 [Armatimonadetes bacterium]|nr:hypothetical protein [Armatimonadota bacterium]